MQKNLPADVRISTDTFRQSRFIESSISNVQNSLYEGAIFVVIVLFLFLANARTTVISLVTLPLSLLVTILVLLMVSMRKKKEDQPPQSLGIPYFREER